MNSKYKHRMSFLAYLKRNKKMFLIHLYVLLGFLLISFFAYFYYESTKSDVVYMLITTFIVIMIYYLFFIYLEYTNFRSNVKDEILREAYNRFERYIVNNNVEYKVVYMGKMLYCMNFQYYILLFHNTKFVVDYTLDDYSFSVISKDERLETIEDLYN